MPINRFKLYDIEKVTFLAYSPVVNWKGIAVKSRLMAAV